mmetsp:Transcript_5476/g.16325  ORF Transcript_5476/g.16325 Transcript_5476/m.16325 type:complete len:441 (-) Transcript_5476:1283-2605(-)
MNKQPAFFVVPCGAMMGLNRVLRRHGFSMVARARHELGVEAEAAKLLRPPVRPSVSMSPAASEMIARRKSGANSRQQEVKSENSSDVLQQRIVSYNILSSTLAQQSHFFKCTPENLESRTRLKRVLSKLQREVEMGSVICLQEVSMAWSGPLSDFFAASGYKFVLGLSGNFSNGYIGVGVAYPLEKFEQVEEHIERLGTARVHKLGEKDGKSSSTTMVEKTKVANDKATSLKVWPTTASTKSPSARSLALDEWAFAKSRSNIFVLLKLLNKETDRTICVSTYHMPCAFFAPKVMVIHAALAAQAAQMKAKADPLVLAGDFNMKKADAAYKLITTGAITEDCGAFPNLDRAGDWKPVLQEPLDSAYVKFSGEEPDFTNYAHTHSTGLFIDSIDYIFVSKNINVTNVDPLPHRSSVKGGSLPSHEEPSDHLMIGAALEIRKE